MSEKPRRPIKYQKIFYTLFLIVFCLSFFSAPDQTAQAGKPLYRVRQNTKCEVDGNLFTVTRPESATYHRKFTYTINEKFERLEMDCGFDLAAAYDGEQFVVFQKTANGEEWKTSSIVEKNSRNAEVVAGVNVAALYDGSYFVVYDRKKNAFFTYPVKYFSDSIYVSAGDDVAILADDDQVVTYDIHTGLFQTMSLAVSHSRVKPVAIAGKASAIAYDGRNVYAYCSNIRNWRIFPAQENLELIPYTNPEGDPISLIQNRHQYTLNSALCTVGSYPSQFNSLR